jgi:hypothetical protein
MIKKLLLIIALLATFSESYSQSYIPLIDTTKYWDVGSYSMNAFCGYSSNPGRYFFNGDTIIGSTNYKKMSVFNFRNFYNNNPICEPFEVDTIYYPTSIFMREEVDNQRVYRYYPETGEEKLLYDFSLSIGDTFNFDLFWGMPIDTIYTITTEDGIERRVLSINKHCLNCPDVMMIEGIGGGSGPFNQLEPYFEFYHFRMCVKDIDTQFIIEGYNCYNFITVGAGQELAKKYNTTLIR